MGSCSSSEVDRAFRNPFHAAIYHGDYDLVTKKLQADPGLATAAASHNGDTSLHVAAKAGRLPFIKLLLKQYKCPSMIRNKKGQTALEALIDALADESEKQLTLLAAEGDKKKVKSELATINTRVCDGIVEFLAEAEDLERDRSKLVDENGDTPLHHATRAGALIPAVGELLTAGFSASQLNKKGETPVLYLLRHVRPTSKEAYQMYRQTINLLLDAEKFESEEKAKNAHMYYIAEAMTTFEQRDLTFYETFININNNNNNNESPWNEKESLLYEFLVVRKFPIVLGSTTFDKVEEVNLVKFFEFAEQNSHCCWCRNESVRCFISRDSVYHSLTAAAAAERAAAPVRCCCSFTIDDTTPHDGVIIDAGCRIITKESDKSWVTLRSREPLSATNNTFYVRIVDIGQSRNTADLMVVGLLPWLPPDQQAELGHRYIGELGGWSFDGSGTCYYEHRWKLDRKVPFGVGSVVQFTIDFTFKKVFVICGKESAVGVLPAGAKEGKVFPAVSLYYKGQKMELL